MSNNLPDITIEELKTCAPKSVRANITPELTNTVNDILQDPDIRDEYRENILGYIDVLKEGKWKFADYIKAVKYVSYKLRGDSNMSAYCKTFPDRLASLQARGVTDISPWVVGYNKTKLVAEIFERSMIPTYVLNADIYQKAVNVQAAIMNDEDASFKVRSDAANSLLTHLKQPETAKVSLDVNVKQDEDGIKSLRDTTAELAKMQRDMIESGSMNAKEAAHQKLIIEDAEYTEE